MYAERSIKTDLIIQIQITRSFAVGADKARESTKNYRRKTVAELKQILKEATTHGKE